MTLDEVTKTFLASLTLKFDGREIIVDTVTSETEHYVGIGKNNNNNLETIKAWHVYRITNDSGKFTCIDTQEFNTTWENRVAALNALEFQTFKTFLFNGVDNHIDAASISPDIGAGAFSCAYWINRSSLGSTIRTTIDDFNTDGSIGWKFKTTATDELNFRTDDGPISDGLKSDFLIDAMATWYSIVHVRDGLGNKKQYINGVLDTAASNDGQLDVTTSTGMFKIGINASDGQPWHGKINDIAVWVGKELSLIETVELYAGGIPYDLKKFSGGIPNRWYRADKATLGTDGVIDLGTDGKNATMINMDSASFSSDVPT